jgi:short-subunit dehydrogenase
MPIQDTTILITGASRGIGKYLARHLAAQGARIALTARDEATLQATCREIIEAGGVARGYVADAADGARAAQVVAEVASDLGSVDTLINNAGIGGDALSFQESDLDALRRIVEVNVFGPMAYTHAVLPAMTARKSGTIINMGSYTGVRALPPAVGYATSKAALVRFTDSVAEGVRDTGVLLFTVSPGMVDTDMTRGIDIEKLLPGVAYTPISEIGRLVQELLTKDVAALSGRFVHVTDDLDELIRHADQIIDEDTYTLRLPKLDGLA